MVLIRARLASLGATLAVAMLAYAPVAAAESRPAVSAKDLPLIKAALVYNICKFVEWRRDRAADEAFVIGIAGGGAGDPDFGSLLGKAVHDRPLRTVVVTGAADVASCHLLFIGTNAAAAWPVLEAAAKAAGVMTVGETDGFASGGGVVELQYDDGRLRFVVNKAAAQANQLRLSSQLLKIAKEIIDGNRPAKQES